MLLSLCFSLFLLFLLLLPLPGGCCLLALLPCLLLLEQDAGGLVSLAGLPLLGRFDDLQTLVRLPAW